MKILIIEDDHQLAQSMRAVIGTYYAAETAEDGEQALLQIAENDFNLVILDLNLPDMSGLQVCREIREKGYNMPVLVVTAEDRPTVMIELLDAGADDYITKPFRTTEFKARVRALLRRQETRQPTMSKLVVGDLALDVNEHCAIRQGKKIHLRSKEFIILEQLMLHPNIVMTRASLLSKAWDDADATWTNTIDVHIKYLRDKIDRPFGTASIQTVHGIGYRLVPITAKPD